MLAFEDLIARSTASTKPFRWVIVQSTCRACGHVHEAQPLLMREHAPDSFIKVLDQATIDANEHAPVIIRTAQLAWCVACHSPAAAEFTKEVKFLTAMYGNTTQLAIKLAGAMERYERAHKKEKFHHA